MRSGLGLVALVGLILSGVLTFVRLLVIGEKLVVIFDVLIIIERFDLAFVVHLIESVAIVLNVVDKENAV